MEAYVWNHEYSSSTTNLYAGKTRQTVEQRIRGSAYSGPNWKSNISGGRVNVIHRASPSDNELTRDRPELEMSFLEQIFINTIKMAATLYPKKLNVLNTLRGFNTSSCCWEKKMFQDYQDKHTNGLPYDDELLQKVVRESLTKWEKQRAY